MSESTTLSPADTASNSSTRQFNVLNLRDYHNVMQEFSQNTKLLSFMQTRFKLSYDLTRGLQLDELKELIGSDRGSNTQLALEEVKKLSNGQSTCLAMPSNDPKASETTVIFGQMFDGRYDVLDIRVRQTTDIDQRKLAAVAVGATCAGILTGIVATPVAGAVATGVILTGAGLTAIHNHQTSRPDLLYGYIFKELNDRHVIGLKDGYPYF